MELRPDSMALRSSTTPRQGDRRRLCDEDGNLQRQKARVVAVAGNSIETPRLLLNSRRASSRTGSPTVRARSAATTCATPRARLCLFDKVDMFKGTTMAGIIATRRVRSQARLRGRLSHGDALARLPFMPRSSIRAPGAASFTTAMDDYANMAGMWIVGEDMPRETNRVTLDPTEGQVRDAGRQRPFRRSPERQGDAQPRLQAGRGDLRRGGREARLPEPPYPCTHNLGTDRMSETRVTAW